MKCLSIAQPFAHLVVTGRKKIELRTWNTRFRGPFLVHAPLKVRAADMRRLGVPEQPTGAIVGRAEISDVRTYETASASQGQAPAPVEPQAGGHRVRVCTAPPQKVPHPRAAQGHAGVL